MTVKEPHYKDWPNEAGFNAVGEVTTPVSLPIKGAFPAYATGVLFRTGPGFYKRPSKASKDGIFSIRHWFDGFTTMHRFELVTKDGKTCDEILYRSRMQAEELVEAAEKRGTIKPEVTFGERDPCDSLYKKVKTSFFAPTEKVAEPTQINIGVAIRRPVPAETAQGRCKERQAGELLTVGTDHPFVKHFDSTTLEPVEVTKQDVIHPSLSGQLSAAHSCEDPVTGDIFNYNLHLGAVHCYRIFRASPGGDVEILAEIKDLGVAGMCLYSQIGSLGVKGAYLHSLALTENFVILAVWPAYYSWKGMSILVNRNMVDSIEYDPTSLTKWFVIDRKSGRGVVRTFTSPSFFCFHTVNAWEEKNTTTGALDVICELVEFPDAKILDTLQYKYIVSTEAVRTRTPKIRDPKAHLTRYRLENIPIKGDARAFVTTKATGEAKKVMSIASGDLPQINQKYALKQHRFVYTMLNREKSSFMDGIGKTDTVTGTTIIWEQERHTPGEPIFIARPGAEEEDDGVILSVILDGDSGTSYLLCLDAKTLTEMGRATAPGPIGLGFHGLHVPKVGQ